MTSDIEIVFQDHEICVHSNGVTHSHGISCTVAELRNWIERGMSNDTNGVFL